MSSFDVLAVGAGMSGLNLIHQCRELGLSVHVLEQGSDVGGTWFWNRYPGARCDIPARDYQLNIAHEKLSDWRWSRRYPAQHELLKYFSWVADRLELRKDISFNEEVKSASWDSAASRWTVVTESGRSFSAKHVVFAGGCLTVPLRPNIPGLNDTFKGPIYYTNRWPAEDVLPSFAGKKVALIGVGSSGVQVLTPLAESAAHVTVFQRHPNHILLAQDNVISEAEAAAYQKEHPERRAMLEASAYGLEEPPRPEPIMSLSEEEFNARMEIGWAYGGYSRIFGAGSDVAMSAEANLRVRTWVQNKMASLISDPAKAKIVSSIDFPMFSKRVIVCDYYFKSISRENVSLVDINPDTGSPLVRVTENAVVTADGKEYEADIIVMATGFDAMTGALVKPDIRGRDGVSLREVWKDGPVCWAGTAIHGFPNFWTVTGPLSPSVLSNMAISTHQSVSWIMQAVKHAVSNNLVADVSPEAQAGWQAFNNFVIGMLCVSNGPSWYRGVNVPGKPQAFLVFPGGLGLYNSKINESSSNGYAGFALTTASA